MEVPDAVREEAAQRASRSALGGFLGRDEDLAELSELLERPGLVTLIGAPGIGKSRLALELGERLAGEFPGGVHRVELAAVSDGRFVAQAVASAGSIQEIAGRTLTATIAAALGEQRSLLVLDNCEHLVEGCASFVETLLDDCCDVSILATSRQPVGVAGETLWEVAPLALPEITAGAVTYSDVLESAAVGLFVERARAAAPSFALNSYVVPAVVEICHRLDGIPLAVEFAAAHAGSLTPMEIARRLDHRFELLADRVPADLPRHQTLLAALEWSHDLLSEPERALLRRLSVFQSGFDIETATAVCRCSDIADVADLVRRLVSKSFVVAVSRDGADGRYRLLETIRAFAGMHLERCDEGAELRATHAGFFLALALEAEPELIGPRQERWLKHLETEHAELRCALEWALGHGHSESALRLAGALVHFWRARCHAGEGCDLLSAALSTADGAAPDLEAKALWGLGVLRFKCGDAPGAAAPLQQSLERYRALGDRQGQARALVALAHRAQYASEPNVLALAEESMALAVQIDDWWCQAHALVVAGYAHAIRDLPLARRLLEKAVQLARRSADRQALGNALNALGMVTYHQSDQRTAWRVLEEALALAEEVGDLYAKATALMYLGAMTGDPARAAALLDASIGGFRLTRQDLPLPLVVRASVARGMGDRALAHSLLDEALAVAVAVADGEPTPVLLELGDLALDEQDVRAARRLFEEALDRGRQTGIVAHTALALSRLAELARDDDDVKRAALLHGEALELRVTFGSVESVLTSIDALASLRAANGRRAQGARLYGATAVLREKHGCPAATSLTSRRESDLELLRATLSDQQIACEMRGGAVLTLEEAAAEAAMNPRRVARAANQQERTPAGWSSLTKSELEVATLAADGLTNREIADRLFMGLGTVKTHLVHVFAKLGVTRRIELAVEARRHDAPDVPPASD